MREKVMYFFYILSTAFEEQQKTTKKWLKHVRAELTRRVEVPDKDSQNIVIHSESS